MCIAMALSGCATITTGTSQTVLVETSPDGAVCRFSRNSKEVGIVNPTPGTLFIDKSSKPLSVICTREGYLPNFGDLKPNFAPMTLGNILLGGVIGIVVDAATGAGSKYDATITIELRKIERADLDRVLDDIKRASP